MSLTTLNWKKLPIRITNLSTNYTASVTNVLRNIADMLTGSVYYDGEARTPGVDSAWTHGGSYTIGTNTEAIYCNPPVKTSLSQSLLIAGRNITGQVSTKTPTLMTYEPSFITNAIYVGLSKNSKTFANWTVPTPFGTGSAFTGLGRITDTVSLTSYTNMKLTVYESQEAMCLTIGYGLQPTQNGGFIAGAIIDPEQNAITGSVDMENDGRIYGVTKVYPIASNFLSYTNEFLGTNFSTISSTTAKFSIFYPQSTSTYSLLLNYPTSISTSNLYTNSNKLIKLSLLFASYPGYRYIGKIRDIYAFRNTANNVVLRDSSNNLLGYAIGASDAAANNCILLTP